jgi:hypothetical protein
MCVISLVLDYGNQNWPQQWSQPPTNPTPPVVAEEQRKFIDAFKKLMEAAKEFDEVTGQADCEDPEKAQLLDRIAKLERRLDEMGV